MFASNLRWIASRLPPSWQAALRKSRYRRLIKAGRFGAGEPEFSMLGEWVHEGDWAIDVGANFGTYTLEISRLVGKGGRVLAFEPILPTFEVLAHLVQHVAAVNVTLLNVAATDRTRALQMDVPSLPTGLPNAYQARVSSEGAVSVLGIAIDDLILDARVALLKIDVEGHESAVLSGARRLIERDRPVLIVEGGIPDHQSFLSPLGYRTQRFESSPNTLFLPDDQRDLADG